MSEVGYDRSPILEVFNKDIGVSNPIAETYGQLGVAVVPGGGPTSAGVGTSNVPGAWLLQTFDLSYRFEERPEAPSDA